MLPVKFLFIIFPDGLNHFFLFLFLSYFIVIYYFTFFLQDQRNKTQEIFKTDVDTEYLAKKPLELSASVIAPGLRFLLKNAH